MPTNRYPTQRKSWTINGDMESILSDLSQRASQVCRVTRKDDQLRLQAGSRFKYRMMGVMNSAKWFPMTITVLASQGPSETVDIQAIGEDDEGRYLFDVTTKKGKKSIGELGFESRFREVCEQLGAPTMGKDESDLKVEPE